MWRWGWGGDAGVQVNRDKTSECENGGQHRQTSSWIRRKVMRGADFYEISTSVQKSYTTVSYSFMYSFFPAKDFSWCLIYNRYITQPVRYSEGINQT